MLTKRNYPMAVGLLMLAFSVHAAPSKQVLTIADVNPKLAAIQGTALDVVKKENITYTVTGQPAYDAFFKDAALAYGGFTVANAMSEDVSTNLKAFARSWAASGAASDALRKLDLKTLSVEQAAEILKDKQHKLGELDKAEAEYFSKASYNIAAAGVSLNGSITASQRLAPVAQQLVSDARNAFKLWESPGVVKDLLSSMQRLTRITDDAMPLVKNLASLTAAIASLGVQAP